jgi:hypothetical protein
VPSSPVFNDVRGGKGLFEVKRNLNAHSPQTPYISSERPQKFAYTNNSNITANAHDENISVKAMSLNVVVSGVAIA